MNNTTTSGAKHSPKPWQVYTRTSSFTGCVEEVVVQVDVQDKHGKTVCGVMIRPDRNAEANARLLAAAPDLLDLVKEAHIFMDSNAEDVSPGKDPYGFHAWLERYDELLATIRG